MRKILLFVVMASLHLSCDRAAPVDDGRVFSHAADIGSVRHAGSVQFDRETEQYTVFGSGANMWQDTDAFHFTWRKMAGDFYLYTSVVFPEEGVDPHRKAGLMIRRNLDPSSAYISAACHGDGLISMQFRRNDGDITEEIRHPNFHAGTMQLKKTGSTVSMQAALEGEPLSDTGELDFSWLSDSCYVGIFVCAHHDDVVEKAIFSNLRITIPAKPDFTPYTDFVGSRVEILHVSSRLRKQVFYTPDNLEAPNWTPDGKYLMLNGRGRLYRLSIEHGVLEEIDTGFATALNNDHGISPDGRQLVISHHVDDLPPGENSILFTLPIEGGTPLRITANGPSYWHGWSPDGKYLIYTAHRNGQWDIYRIPAIGGEEEQLTNSPGLDDGSEYSADGKYIWFNSVRSGRMEIWRMLADGGDPVQMTDDPWQNWFPHPAPDDSHVIFLSYIPYVQPSDHPYYQDVMLRMLDVASGQIHVVAHLYGGQGTINVPSWSPDGAYVAFVSNTDPY